MRSICDNSCSIALLDRDVFLFFWTKCRRRKSLASERAHENDEMIAEHRQTTEAEHGLHSLRQDNKCAT